MDFAGRGFDAAIYLYGQFTVLRPAESLDVCGASARRCGPAASCCSKSWTMSSSTRRTAPGGHRPGGLWGDFPYLHLGECTWDPDQRAAVERFHILNLETGEMQVYGLSDQAYTAAR